MTDKRPLSIERIGQIQEEILDLTLKSIAIIAIPMLILEIIVGLLYEWNAQLIAGLTSGTALLIGSFLRTKLSRSLKTAALVVPVWGISVFLLLNDELQGFGAMFLLASHILAALFMNRTHIWYFIITSVTTLVSIAFLVPKQKEIFHESWAWAALILSICSLTYMIAQLDIRLRGQIKRLFEQIDFRFNRIKEIAQAEMDKQKTELNHKLLEAELLKQALRQLSLDSRQSVHDILGLSHLLSQRIYDPEFRDILGHISSNCRQIRGMITQSSELAMGNSLRNTQVEFDLLKQARELLNAFEAKAQTNGIILKLVIDPSIPPIVNGNGPMINNILRSFFQIAIAHTLRGQITLQMIWEGEKEGKDLIRWIIRDNGFGLTRSQWDAIWNNAFDELNLPTQPIAARVIQTSKIWASENGGSLEGKSEAGKGTEFQLSLALAKPIARDQIWAEWVLSLRGTHVLLVDDRPYSSQILSQYLDELGLIVHIANSNAEAIKKAYSGVNFKLIFISIEIEGLVGFEISKQLRQVFNKKAGILLVAHTIEPDLDMHLKCDADGVLELPFGRTSLVAKVVDVLRHYVPAPIRKNPQNQPNPSNKGRVLVIGAHEIERWVFQELLKKNGYDVHQARSNEEAMQMLDAPEGWTLILHANDPTKADTFAFHKAISGRNIALIAILSEDDQRKNNVEFPHLLRPVNPEILAEKVQELLSV